jgi:hypothetical protein
MAKKLKRGRPLNKTVGAPLAAGYFGDGNPTLPGEFGDNTIEAPWNWQPNAADWNMSFGDWSSVPSGYNPDPFAGGPEDQPGFGQGPDPDGTNWSHTYGDNECPIGYVLLPTGECVSAGAGGGWANYQDYNPYQGWHGGFVPYSNLDHWGWDEHHGVDYSVLEGGWGGGQEYTLDVTNVISPTYCQENSGTSAYLWDPETETCWANVGLYLGTCPDGQSWSDQLNACVSTDNFMSGQEIEWDGNYGFQCPEGQVPGILGGCVDA